jgi:pimeloyl-ACP methyl ester carboxylesterase
MADSSRSPELLSQQAGISKTTSSQDGSTTGSNRDWSWQGFSIRYQVGGSQGPPVVLVHGFGASGHHWRKNLAALAEISRVYVIDLIGFGGSAKPAPGPLKPGEQVEYSFETWGQQIADFCREVVGEPVFLVGNSIGCIAAMQAAVYAPEMVLSLALLNCSLRLLHDRKRITLPWYRRVTAPIAQKILSFRPLGQLFFNRLARPSVVRKILLQAYKNPQVVTDELVELLLIPARDPGAVEVFLAFTRYSQGPLPEDLLAMLSCPALLLWGTEDPWEPIALGRELARFPSVEAFIPLEGVGHCPQDEAPELVNPILRDWILKKTSEKLSHT